MQTQQTPLSAPQRAHLERRLLQERALVLRTLDRIGRLQAAESEERASSTRLSDHLAEHGSEAMQQTLDAVFASRDTATLQEIDAALRRLYRTPARFGVDERTGEPIPFERLDIIPWARRLASTT